MSADPFDTLAVTLRRHLTPRGERHIRCTVIEVDPLEVRGGLRDELLLHEDDDDVEVTRAVRDLITYDGDGAYTGSLHHGDLVDVREENDRYIVSGVIYG